MYRRINKKLIIRYLMFLLGLMIVSFGVAFSKRTGSGTSPVSVIPAVMSDIIPISMGTHSIILNVCFIISQIVILKKEYDLIQLLQLPIAIIFGTFIDFANLCVGKLRVDHIIFIVLYMIISMCLIAFGVYLEVKAQVLLLPAEGLMTAICKKTGWEFPPVKVVFDSTMVIVAVILSLTFLHRLQGVREGTVIAAVCIGLIVKVYMKNLHKLNAFFDMLKTE